MLAEGREAYTLHPLEINIPNIVLFYEILVIIVALVVVLL